MEEIQTQGKKSHSDISVCQFSTRFFLGCRSGPRFLPAAPSLPLTMKPFQLWWPWLPLSKLQALHLQKHSHTKLFHLCLHTLLPTLLYRGVQEAISASLNQQEQCGAWSPSFTTSADETACSTVLTRLDCWLKCPTALLQMWCRSEIMLTSNAFFPSLVKLGGVISLSFGLLLFTAVL